MKDSRFWSKVWGLYPTSPSIAMCRIPELEYAATLEMGNNTLDHCCGDGLFASAAWPRQKIYAGCDLNEKSIRAAEKTGMYERYDACDASKELPYEDASFELIFDNSALEHIKDLHAALQEVSRVLKPNGVFTFNVLNHRYFEWWPLSDDDKVRYREWQPFFHALNIEEWRKELEQVGLQLDSYEGYFDRKASRILAYLDCEFSGYFLGQRPSLTVSLYKRFPRIARRYWKWRIGRLEWKTEPDEGAGYFIRAVKRVG